MGYEDERNNVETFIPKSQLEFAGGFKREDNQSSLSHYFTPVDISLYNFSCSPVICPVVGPLDSGLYFPRFLMQMSYYIQLFVFIYEYFHFCTLFLLLAPCSVSLHPIPFRIGTHCHLPNVSSSTLLKLHFILFPLYLEL